MRGGLKTLINFWTLHRQNKKLVLIVFPLLVLIRVSFLCLPYRWFRRFFIDIAQAKGDRLIGKQIEAWRILRIVDAVGGKLTLTNHCLTKAVAAKLLLNRAGFAVDFRIGVSMASGGKIDGHAWLESDGRVVLGYLNDLGRYTVFPGMNRKDSSVTI